MINWDKIWDDFDEMVTQDANEGKRFSLKDHRQYVQMLVEKQLREGT